MYLYDCYGIRNSTKIGLKIKKNRLLCLVCYRALTSSGDGDGGDGDGDGGDGDGGDGDGGDDGGGGGGDDGGGGGHGLQQMHRCLQ
jgi:hypothetical protein